MVSSAREEPHMQNGGRSMKKRPIRRWHAKQNSSGESSRDAEGDHEIQAPASESLQLSRRVLSLMEPDDPKLASMRCSARAVRDF